MKKQVKLTAKSENTCKKSLRTKSRFSSMRMILPNAVLLKLCSIRAPRRPYEQNAAFWDLPVNASPTLRAKWLFLGFARKCQPPITGKTAIFQICP